MVRANLVVSKGLVLGIAGGVFIALTTRSFLGVLLHYDDATLKDMYFLDPQWLCDILAHVITIREINPFAKNGLMKTDDLKILFKSSTFAPANIRSYLLSLLQKFEVGLSWDNRTLLIPSLLPDEYQLRAGYPGCEVKVSGGPLVCLRLDLGPRYSLQSAISDFRFPFDRKGGS